MGTTHRGMPTGNNHRPTPRLSRLIAEQSNSLYGVTPEKAQGMVDEYRDKREWAKVNKSSKFDARVADDASAINDFIKNR